MAGQRRTRDHFTRRAKRENYPARSIYKLEEIDNKAKLLRTGDNVVDLGAAPGSWTLYAAKKVGLSGTVVAIDRAPITIGVPKNVVTMEASALDIEASSLREYCGEKGFDVVISDMAPRTSGQRFVDQSRSFELFCRALEIGDELLRPGGRFVGKIFQGEDFEAAREKVRQIFNKARIFRPQSIRSESYEVYLVGLDKR